jgi:LPS O-antigen subunit length determinant protein (WzzB/FepE family)
MQQDNQQTYPYQADEIDLRKLAKSLKERRWGIFGLTGFVTLLAIVYVLLLPPPSISYIATASFVSPSQSSVLTLNKFPLTSETSESIYTSFLKKLSSTDFKEKVFYENDYLTVLNPENEPIDNVEEYVSGFISSVSVEATKDKDEVVDNLLEKPYSISMVGSDSDIISRYLSQLVTSANSETVNDLINITKQKVDIRLDEISEEGGLLLVKAKQDRLSQIERIKEEDSQKIRELNDQIDRARYKAKQDRLNQIQILTVAAQLAGSLGIIENNLGQISGSNNEISLNIAINENENKDLPEWYLFGEKALLERVELLENRTSDDAFIPELVTLQNQINEVQNNNTLKALEERENDIPFLTVINKAGEETNLIHELDIEKINLESFDPSPSGIDAMQLTQSAKAEQIPQKPSKKMIIALALFGGFVFSIFLALLTNLFKEDETEPTTK